MSEAPTTTEVQPDAELGDAGKKALQAEREARKQAEKSAADLQAAVDKLTADLETEKTARQADVEAAKAEATAAQTVAARYKLAATHHLTPEDAELFLTAGTEEAMQAQAERLAARTAADVAPRNPAPDPTQGGTAPPPASTSELFAQAVGDFLN